MGGGCPLAVSLVLSLLGEDISEAYPLFEQLTSSNVKKLFIIHFKSIVTSYIYLLYHD